MAFDYLTGSVGDYLSNPQVQTPTLADSPLSTSFWSGAGDFLSSGLDTWLKIEQIQAVKDSGTYGQQEVIKTVQTPNPNSDNTYRNPSMDLYTQAQNALQMGTGTYIAIGGAILLLWFLTKK
jgi:hypothetical protein